MKVSKIDTKENILIVKTIYDDTMREKNDSRNNYSNRKFNYLVILDTTKETIKINQKEHKYLHIEKEKWFVKVLSLFNLISIYI